METLLTGEDVVALFQRRVVPGRALVDEAERVARACYDMAVRFHRGGTLLVFGNGGPSTDAQHVAVEFVHPVIVGERAFPAIALTNDVATVTGVALLSRLHRGRKLFEKDLWAYAIRHGLLKQPAAVRGGPK